MSVVVVKDEYKKFQCEFVKNLEDIAKEKIYVDNWDSVLGEGLSCVLQDNKIFDKLGVNFSIITDKQLPKSALQSKVNKDNLQNFNYYDACGISIIIHPNNPYIPTFHMNVRYFSLKNLENNEVKWWFGGGLDATPYYPQIKDCVMWHLAIKKMCDKYLGNFYDNAKKACDKYFYLNHRNEYRGIGGIFFDEFSQLSFADSLKMTLDVAEVFSKQVQKWINDYINYSWSDQEKEFQLFRRGRYVEFNLLYDRGTRFGLESKGRIESIFVSLPQAKWPYCFKIKKGSKEDSLKDFLQPRKWCDGIKNMNILPSLESI